MAPPVEIGAFVNDTCVGACKVNNSDSLAFIRGYLQGNSGDSVTFVNYYGNKSTQKQEIKSYYVKSPGEPFSRKRAVTIGENKGFYLISFNKPQDFREMSHGAKFLVCPNPVSAKLLFDYAVPTKGNVTVSVHDMQGRLVAVLLQEVKEKGNYSAEWDLNGTDGLKVNRGIYLLRLNGPAGSSVKKVIVN